jgi:SAM-dependent methyltransferase
MSGKATPRRFPPEEVLDVYRKHPLRAQRVLERVLAQRGTLAGIDEWDLARDRQTGITDQNHVGGARAVRELARCAKVCEADNVLDLGCGLGGAPRLLAHLYGCRVHGVDFSDERCRDAEHLTRLVGLANLVTFERADFLSVSVPRGRYELLWGQSTWAHVRDKAAFLERWTRALKPGGRLAFEEVCLHKRPRSRASSAVLRELEDCWKSYIVTRDEWLSSLPLAYRVERVEDLSAAFVANFSRLMEHAAAAGWDRYNSLEVAGWHHAHLLAETGLLGYVRVVAGKGGA